MELGLGRLTQLLALIGPGGTWRRTLADKAIAWVPIALNSSFGLSTSQVVVKVRCLPFWWSRPATLHRRTLLKRYAILASVGQSTWVDSLDGDFIIAEPHLLASGQRDSARILAEMLLQWSEGDKLGLFALRGSLPYVILIFCFFMLTRDPVTSWMATSLQREHSSNISYLDYPRVL